MQGYAQLHGSEDQLNAVAGSDDFQRLIADAQMIVDDVSLTRGVTDQGVADQIGIFQEAISKVPQMA